MVVKVYVSGISGNKEVKKRQQRVLLILDSKNVKYEVLDIAEPNMEEAKEYMQNNSKLLGGTIGDPNPRHPLPPQIFNDDEYCGDYDAFDMANEVDEMEKFLKVAPGDIEPITTTNAEIKLDNGEITNEAKSKEASPVKDEPSQPEEEPKVEETEPELIENGKKDETEDTSESGVKEESAKEKSPSPQKEELAEDKAATGDNETDDQKSENAANGSKEEELEAAKDTDETEKSEEA